jgi:hypothetical protein
VHARPVPVSGFDHVPEAKTNTFQPTFFEFGTCENVLGVGGFHLPISEVGRVIMPLIHDYIYLQKINMCNVESDDLPIYCVRGNLSSCFFFSMTEKRTFHIQFRL